MYLVAIAWMYVVLMMAVAEATSSQGSVLGAVVTMLLYGVLPVAIVMYLLGTPMRNKARREREAAQDSAAAPSAVGAQDGSAGGDGNGGGEAPGLTVASKREEA